MNTRNFVSKIACFLILCTLCYAQNDSTKTEEKKTWDRWDRNKNVSVENKNDENYIEVLTPTGEIKRIYNKNANTQQMQLNDSIPLNFKLFNYYEKNKIDKINSVLNSILLPGAGFLSLNRTDKFMLFFGLSIGSAIFIFSTNNSSEATLFYIIHSLARIGEFYYLCANIDSYNEELRYNLQFKFKLK